MPKVNRKTKEKGILVWLRNWKNEFLSHKFLIFLSVLFLIVASILNLSASRYTDRVVAVHVPDIILDNLPTVDLDGIFIYGILLVYLVAVIYVVVKIKNFHVAVTQFSLLVLIRSFFVILTHMAQPAGALVLTNLPKIYNFFNFYNDLFFSGHTAVPFLLFLVFRKEKIGKFFLVMSIVMAITVLLMHVHYSIDVFAAFFITYSSYKIGEFLLKKLNNKSTL